MIHTQIDGVAARWRLVVLTHLLLFTLDRCTEVFRFVSYIHRHKNRHYWFAFRFFALMTFRSNYTGCDMVSGGDSRLLATLSRRDCPTHVHT